jgi:putative peptidoglycan lipid II flippase
MLSLPLLLSGIFNRWTPVIDRYLISGLPSGNIALLGYAYQIVQLGALLISSGIGTVIFPHLASSAANNNLAELRQTVSLSLRLMWLLVAPIITIGAVLAFPAVLLVFARGQFDIADATSVAALLRIYLLALGGMALGSLTGRSLYSLKATRLVAIGGVTQAIVYVGYTAVLVHIIGAAGAALGYVLLFNGSLLWQLLFIRRMIGGTGGRNIVTSFLRTGMAALIGGGTAWAVGSLTINPWLELAFGGLTGMVSYAAMLFLSGSTEVRLCRDIALSYAAPTIEWVSARLRAG